MNIRDILNCFTIKKPTLLCNNCHNFCHVNGTSRTSLEIIDDKRIVVSDYLNKHGYCNINNEFNRRNLPFYLEEITCDDEPGQNQFLNKNLAICQRLMGKRIPNGTVSENNYEEEINYYDTKTIEEPVYSEKMETKTKPETYTAYETRNRTVMVSAGETIAKTETTSVYNTWSHQYEPRIYKTYHNKPAEYATESYQVPIEKTRTVTKQVPVKIITGYTTITKQVPVYKKVLKTIKKSVYITKNISVYYFIRINNNYCDSCQCNFCTGLYPKEDQPYMPPNMQWEKYFMGVSTKTCLVCGENHHQPNQPNHPNQPIDSNRSDRFEIRSRKLVTTGIMKYFDNTDGILTYSIKKIPRCQKNPCSCYTCLADHDTNIFSKLFFGLKLEPTDNLIMTLINRLKLSNDDYRFLNRTESIKRVRDVLNVITNQ